MSPTTSSLKPWNTFFTPPWGLLLLLMSSCILFAAGELHSSVERLTKLGDIESTLLQGFRSYLKRQQDDVAALRRFMKRIEVKHTLADEDMEDYLENPINAFKLIKRVVRDWSSVNDVLKFEEAQSELREALTQLNETSNSPKEPDLTAAILDLARLQYVHNRDAEDMAIGKGYGSSLSWRDCLEIATTYADEKFYDLATDWLKIANAKLNESVESADVKIKFSHLIKENLAYNLLATGEQDEAVEHLDEVLDENSDHIISLTKKYMSKIAKASDESGLYGSCRNQFCDSFAREE